VQRIDSKDASGIEQSSGALFSELVEWIIVCLHEGLLPLRVRDCRGNQCRHLRPPRRHDCGVLECGLPSFVALLARFVYQRRLGLRGHIESTTFAERRSTKPGSLSLLHDLGWLGAAQNARKQKRPPTALLFSPESVDSAEPYYPSAVSDCQEP